MDHTPEHIWLLIARKLSGEINPEELRELDELIRQDPDAGYSKELFHDLWHTQPVHDSHYAESRYRELVQQMKNMGIDEGKFGGDDTYISYQAPAKKRRMPVMLVSAILIAVIAGGFFYLSGRQDPGDLAETNSINQISTKNGSKTSLVLPDGTKVWLNSGSQLVYDKSFGNKIREVSLVGEAYFDVVKNPARAFVIHTKKMDIKVVGTAFNVKCYPGEKTTETSLVRGSIEVTLKDRQQEKIMLKPNEKLVINNEELSVKEGRKLKGSKLKMAVDKPIISVSHLTFFPVDSTVIETAWVKNLLVFSSESFEDVALKMERWYNVKIEFADESLKDERLTGNFEKETVTEAFDALRLTTRFFFTIKNDKIFVSRNSNARK